MLNMKKAFMFVILVSLLLFNLSFVIAETWNIDDDVLESETFCYYIVYGLEYCQHTGFQFKVVPTFWVYLTDFYLGDSVNVDDPFPEGVFYDSILDDPLLDDYFLSFD